MCRNRENSFVAPTLGLSTLDTYLARRSISSALRTALPTLKGRLLDVGCGYMPYKELVLRPPSEVTSYLGLDLPPGPTYARRPDVVWDGRTIPLEDQSIDSVMSTEVLEHCPRPDLVLAEIARVLRPGGRLFFTVPFLWPLHDAPHDEYRYTPFALRRLLQEAGFGQIELSPLGGWDASLAQMIGLWTRRRPLSRLKRFLVSLAALPTIWLLARVDNLPSLEWNVMITGMSGTARKPQ